MARSTFELVGLDTLAASMLILSRILFFSIVKRMVLRFRKASQPQLTGARPANPPTCGNHNATPRSPHEASGSIIGYASALRARQDMTTKPTLIPSPQNREMESAKAA